MFCVELRLLSSCLRASLSSFTTRAQQSALHVRALSTSLRVLTRMVAHATHCSLLLLLQGVSKQVSCLVALRRGTTWAHTARRGTHRSALVRRHAARSHVSHWGLTLRSGLAHWGLALRSRLAHWLALRSWLTHRRTLRTRLAHRLAHRLTLGSGLAHRVALRRSLLWLVCHGCTHSLGDCLTVCVGVLAQQL